MLDHDFGKMCTCKYHLFDDPGYDGPFTPTLIDKWWPRYIKLEELFILYKIYELAEKRDGSIIEISDSDLGYLFMTYRDKKQVNGYITPVYTNILQQGVSFMNKSVVEMVRLIELKSFVGKIAVLVMKSL